MKTKPWPKRARTDWGALNRASPTGASFPLASAAGSPSRSGDAAPAGTRRSRPALAGRGPGPRGWLERRTRRWPCRRNRR
eukprot:9075948-Pyramimonas_sp.AAC.1